MLNSSPMALKRQLSQPSPGATPARKAPRLTLAIPIPSSPDPISTAPTVVSPAEDDRVPILPPSALTPAVSRPTPFIQLDPVQLVAQLEELAAEYERSVDDMGAEIAELKRKVRLAERRLEATPSMEDCRVTTSCYSPASRSKQVARGKSPFVECWCTYRRN